MTEELRGRAAAAVRAAGRLMEGGDWKDEARLGSAVDELLSLGRELIQHEVEFPDVFVHVALLIGARCHLRRDGTTPDPDERAEALRRLRRVDHHVRDFVAHTGIRERQSAAQRDRLLAYRTGDPGYLDDAAALLREAIDASPDGSWWGVVLQAELVDLLEQAAVYGGSFHDADVALATLRELRAALERDGSVPPDVPFVLDLALSAAELSHAQRTGDHGELPRLGEELLGRYAALPPDVDRRGALEERIAELDALLRPPRQDGRMSGGAVGPARPEAAASEILSRAISELRRDLDDPQLYHDQEYDRRGAIGLRTLLDVVRGEGPGELLDEAITELTRARVLITEGRGRAHRVDVLTKPAEAHLMRAARGGPHRAADQRDCIDVFREALGELAAAGPCSSPAPTTA
jgi:hypothetical protein